LKIAVFLSLQTFCGANNLSSCDHSSCSCGIYLLNKSFPLFDDFSPSFQIHY
jgi:parallel beta-helix repeat protein